MTFLWGLMLKKSFIFCASVNLSLTDTLKQTILNPSRIDTIAEPTGGANHQPKLTK